MKNPRNPVLSWAGSFDESVFRFCPTPTFTLTTPNINSPPIEVLRPTDLRVVYKDKRDGWIDTDTEPVWSLYFVKIRVGNIKTTVRFWET